jgi:hypothetical protein
MNKTQTDKTVTAWPVPMKDHGDHVTTGRVHPDGPWVSMIAQPQQAFDGRVWWVANAWVHGMLEGSSGLCSTVEGAFASAFADACAACLYLDGGAK